MSAAPELQPRTRPRPGPPRSRPPTGASRRVVGPLPAVAVGDGRTLWLLPGACVTDFDPAPTNSVPLITAPEAAVNDLAGVDPGEVSEPPGACRLNRLPDPRPLAGQLAQAVVEVLAGDRPVAQLLTWLTEPLYQELSVLAPDPVTTPTLRGARIVTVRPQDRPKVRSVHVSRPTDGVAEVAARVQTNGRSRAVAFRLEEWRGRWRCCALTIG